MSHTMGGSDPEGIPGRMLTTTEAQNLQDGIVSYAETAPVLGLESRDQGPGTGSRAVVGIYLGLRNSGAHLMGFNPNRDDWETASIIKRDDVTDPDAMVREVGELIDWLEMRFPDEKFVVYKKVSPRVN